MCAASPDVISLIAIQMLSCCQTLNKGEIVPSRHQLVGLNSHCGKESSGWDHASVSQSEDAFVEKPPKYSDQCHSCMVPGLHCMDKEKQRKFTPCSLSTSRDRKSPCSLKQARFACRFIKYQQHEN